MVVSHKHRYVFVQTMKTASTSMAKELCDKYDGEMILDKHASIDKYLEQATEDEKSYFSFAGVRNPLDVAVSRFELRKTGDRNGHHSHREQTLFIQESGGDFNAYFNRYVTQKVNKRHDVAVVPLNWRSKSFQAIDYIYHYENLQESFSTILEKIGIEKVRDLPQRNVTVGKAGFLSYYDTSTLDTAYRLFFPYLDCWGYEVPPEVRAAVVAQRQARRQVDVLKEELKPASQGFLAKTLFRRQMRINRQLLTLVEALVDKQEPG